MSLKFCTAAVTAVLILGLLAGCFAGARSTDSNDGVFASYNFPAPDDVTHLCGQNVLGSGREIKWDAFASADEPAALVEYYRRKLGDAGFTKEGEGGAWRLPTDAARPQRILHVMPTGAESPARSCEKKLPANSRSVILVSRMY